MNYRVFRNDPDPDSENYGFVGPKFDNRPDAENYKEELSENCSNEWVTFEVKEVEVESKNDKKN